MRKPSIGALKTDGDNQIVIIPSLLRNNSFVTFHVILLTDGHAPRQHVRSAQAIIIVTQTWAEVNKLSFESTSKIPLAKLIYVQERFKDCFGRGT